MELKKEQKKDSEIELSIEVSSEEYKPYLVKAAAKLSKEVKIEGFRPGKAPYDIVKNKVGEMNIYQEALDAIISNFYWQAVSQEKLDTVGQPKIDIEKMAPGNPIAFKATVSLMPKVTLGDYKSVKVKKEEIKIDDKEVDKAINDLRKMQVKETLAEREAKKDDRVEVDFEVKLDKVPVDGGQGKKYPIVIGSGSMIPGFEDQLIGLKAGEEKEFQLKFPTPYQNKMLEGKLCDFKVKMLSVYNQELPESTDDWAKGLGAESLEDLKSKIKDNLSKEKEYQEDQRVELEMLKKIVDQTKFSEIPETLIHSEAHRMVHEFGDSIAAQGIPFADYLKSIKKEEKDLEKEFEPKALDRVKTSIVIKEIADKEKIEATEKELKEETDKILLQVQNNPEAQENIKSEGYQHYLKTIVKNKKVVEMIRKECIS